MNTDTLVERAVCDLLNSVSVTRDVVSYRANRPITRRIFEQLTGKDRRIAELFDDHTSRSIENLLVLTNLLCERLTLSDLTQTKVIRKLTAIVRRLDEQGTETKSIKEQVRLLETRFAQQLAILTGRVDTRDTLEHGYYALKVKINSGAFNLVDLWRFIDALWWGGYGLVQRRPEQAVAAAKLREEVSYRLHELLSKELGLDNAFPLQAKLREVKPLPADEQEVFDLLALDPDWRMRPVSRAIADRVGDRADLEIESMSVPVLTTVERLTERLFVEAQRAGAG
jgi:hypothetical protein